MKTLHYSIIVFSIAGLLIGTSNSVYAPCPIGVTDCGPPPGVTVSIGTDSQFYEKNDTIAVQGRVYVQNYNNPITIQVVGPNNTKLQSIDLPVTDGKFDSKIPANFDKTGLYQIVACIQNWCDRSYFKFIAEPYELVTNGQDFFIKYKSFADLVGMETDVSSQALRVHISNATAQGLQFVIELPRTLIDSKGYAGNDASFRVLIGMHQPDKYMQPVNFTEISSNDKSRTLAIDIPYEPVPNSSGTWDFKIMSIDAVSRPTVFIESPLKQFKSGIALKDIKCASDLQLLIKANSRSPACIKPDDVSKLVERGWADKPNSLQEQLDLEHTCIGPNIACRNVESNSLSESDCGQFYTVPENHTSLNTIPVLLMKMNSTACAKLTFTIISNYNDCNGPNCQHVLDVKPTGLIGNLHYEKHGDSFSITSGKDYDNSFKIVTIPSTVDLANYPIGTNYTVTYIIRPLANATGFYDQSIPRLVCERYPLAVGYAADQVNASDFSYIDPLNPPCASGAYVLTKVEVSGMDYKEVTLRLAVLEQGK